MVATGFWKISSRYFSGTWFGSIYSIKLSLNTVLSSIRTLERYCEATLNVFSILNKWWQKNFIK